MTDETTNESNDKGKKADTPVTEPATPVSLYDKTEAIVTRQEEANKKREELLEREEKLHANQRLAGTAGGRVEPTPPPIKETPHEYHERIKKEMAEGKTEFGD